MIVADLLSGPWCDDRRAAALVWLSVGWLADPPITWAPSLVSFVPSRAPGRAFVEVARFTDRSVR